MLRIEHGAAIKVDDLAAQAEFRHFDYVTGIGERQRLPGAAPRVDFDAEFARIDDDGVEIVRRLAVAAQLQFDLGAGVGGGQDLRREQKMFRVQIISPPVRERPPRPAAVGNSAGRDCGRRRRDRRTSRDRRPLRAGCEELADDRGKIPGESAARGPTNAAVERREAGGPSARDAERLDAARPARTAQACLQVFRRAASWRAKGASHAPGASRRSAPLARAGTSAYGVPGAANNTGGGALAKSLGSKNTQVQNIWSASNMLGHNRKMSGAECLAEMLNGYGVTHVFMVPAVLRKTFAEMERRTKIARIHTHGEKSAAYMADGYTRASGKPGICMAQVIGALNLAAGLRDAWLAHSPVIAFTGGRDPKTKFRKVYQEIDDVPAFEPVTKFNATIDDVNRFPDMVRQAF